MFVVMYKGGAWLNIQQQVFGPFSSHDQAYEFLCELPPPGEGGHKWIHDLSNVCTEQAKGMIMEQDSIATGTDY